MRSLPQEQHADLGIVPDQDRTEDLRKSAPEPQVRQHLAGTDPNNPLITRQEF
ncbi:hypothetical protein [Mycobacterium sp. E802]|uniref:hypothetical protein n=1 Tax=Mycobacterium sp. E802 TaxID=1834152 RepID=UPI000AE5C692|nr:hypothetical protein [Mycobacterium sp. E802]